MTMSPDQAVAFDGILKWSQTSRPGSMATLAGYAGCGKTWLMGQIGADWQRMGVRVRYVSPTGKAALVAAQHLEAAGLRVETSTIHSAFLRPIDEDGEGRREIKWGVKDRQGDRDPDVIVVDEASMLTAGVLRKAQNACSSSRFLFVGDHFQLPAIGDDAGVMRSPTWRLETIMRQAEGSPIVTFAHMVRTESIDSALRYARTLKGEHEGDAPLLFADGTIGPESTRRAIGWALELGHDDGMIIVAKNNTRGDLNRIARSAARGENGSYDAFPEPGDMLICDLTAPIVGLVNGERFRVERVTMPKPDYVCVMPGSRTALAALDASKDAKSDYHAAIMKARSQAYEARRAGMPVALFPGAEAHADLSCSYGYVLTCHKAQGSQAKRVLVAVDDHWKHPNHEERRRWLYTAVTRASESVRLVRHMRPW